MNIISRKIQQFLRKNSIKKSLQHDRKTNRCTISGKNETDSVNLSERGLRKIINIKIRLNHK